MHLIVVLHFKGVKQGLKWPIVEKCLVVQGLTVIVYPLRTSRYTDVIMMKLKSVTDRP